MLTGANRSSHQGFYRAPQHVYKLFSTDNQWLLHRMPGLLSGTTAHVYKLFSTCVFSTDNQWLLRTGSPLSGCSNSETGQSDTSPLLHDLGQSQLLQKTWDLQFSLYCTASSQALPDPLQNKGEPGKSDLAGCGQLIPNHVIKMYQAYFYSAKS